jgi:hypothetical protein
MNRLIHRSSSIGSLIKKITVINPSLGVQEIIQLVRQATRTRGASAGDYASLEIVDEQLALDLAKGTLSPPAERVL